MIDFIEEVAHRVTEVDIFLGDAGHVHELVQQRDNHLRRGIRFICRVRVHARRVRRIGDHRIILVVIAFPRLIGDRFANW